MQVRNRSILVKINGKDIQIGYESASLGAISLSVFGIPQGRGIKVESSKVEKQRTLKLTSGIEVPLNNFDLDELFAIIRALIFQAKNGVDQNMFDLNIIHEDLKIGTILK